MNVFEVKIGVRSAALTCYVQHTDRELPALECCPAVLILPGGAYSYCSAREAEPVAIAYMQAGFNAFVLRYSTGRDCPRGQILSSALSEAEESLDYLRAHAMRLHIDSEKIAVVGFSAGGHLAGMLGTSGRVRPNALVLGYATVNSRLNELGLDAAIVLDNIDSSTPPAFLFATQGDRLVPAVNSLQFAARLAEYKIPYELHIFAYGDHGASIGTEVTANSAALANADVTAWVGMSVTFLHHIFRGDALVPVKQDASEYGLDMSIGRLVSDERSLPLILSYLPELKAEYDKSPSCGSITPRRLQMYTNGMFDEGKLDALGKALGKLNI